MSVLKTCECGKKYGRKKVYRIIHYHHNHSHFESPKGEEHYSEYSGIICLKCEWSFRSKAKWVEEIPFISKKEQLKLWNQIIFEEDYQHKRS